MDGLELFIPRDADASDNQHQNDRLREYQEQKHNKLKKLKSRE